MVMFYRIGVGVKGYLDFFHFDGFLVVIIRRAGKEISLNSRNPLAIESPAATARYMEIGPLPTRPLSAA